MLWIIAIVILFGLAVSGGAWGRTRYGGWSWSPAVIILLVAAALYFTGHISFHG